MYTRLHIFQDSHSFLSLNSVINSLEKYQYAFGSNTNKLYEELG